MHCIACVYLFRKWIHPSTVSFPRSTARHANAWFQFPPVPCVATGRCPKLEIWNPKKCLSYELDFVVSAQVQGLSCVEVKSIIRMVAQWYIYIYIPWWFPAFSTFLSTLACQKSGQLGDVDQLSFGLLGLYGPQQPPVPTTSAAVIWDDILYSTLIDNMQMIRWWILKKQVHTQKYIYIYKYKYIYIYKYKYIYKYIYI